MDGAGGSGASCCAGGGGYSGGSPEYLIYNSANGLPGYDNTTRKIAGSGYFMGADGYDTTNNIYRHNVVYGGLGSMGAGTNNSHTSGHGGTAGKGGNIKVSSTAEIFAFNGNLYTDGTDYQNGINQCPIYLQASYYPAKYAYSNSSSSGNIILVKNEEAKSNVPKSGYQNNMYLNGINNYTSARYMNINEKLGIEYCASVFNNIDLSYQGIGSGAGYIEVSNGTYKVDSSLN